MTERGGPTTQSGIYYQNSIAALFLGRLMDTRERPLSDSIDEVIIESIQDVDDINITFSDGHKKYLQAKEKVSFGDNEWNKAINSFYKQYVRNDFNQEKDILGFWIGINSSSHMNFKDLCTRAKTCNSYGDLVKRINKPQQKILSRVKTYLFPDIIDESLLVSFLSRIEIEICSITQIERDYVQNWIPESSLSSKILFEILLSKAGKGAGNRVVFSTQELIQDITNEYQSFAIEPSISDKKHESNFVSCSSILRTVKTSFGSSCIHIQRNVVNEIFNWINSYDHKEENLAILVDQAGTGKTVALHDLLVSLEEKGINTLAIKADQQLTGIKNISDISKKLGFEQPIFDIIRFLNRNRKTVVIIDQIDALSLSLAHDQSTLDVVLDFIARLRQLKNIKIVIACRIFDLKSDPRLENFRDYRKFIFDNLTEIEISDVLKYYKIEYSKLSNSTKELLRTPLHLNLFTLILENGISINSNHYLHIASLSELYTAIWEKVVLKNDLLAPDKKERVNVLKLCTNYMDENQITNIPNDFMISESLLNFDSSIKWLASMGILINGSKSWTFIHQTFFDYCYARFFAESGKNPSEAIINSDQGIFFRSRMIQLILYFRDAKPLIYFESLKNLLTTNQLRFHLQELLLSWLGVLPNPSDFEFEIIDYLISDKHRCELILRKMYGNPVWFDHLKLIEFSKWFADDQLIETYALPYLQSIVDNKQSQEKVILFLKKYIGINEIWDNRLIKFASGIRIWHCSESVEFYKELFIRKQNYTKFDIYEINVIAKSYPLIALQLISHLILQSITNERNTPYIYKYGHSSILGNLNQHDINETIHKISIEYSFDFIKEVFPLFIQMISLTNSDSSTLPYDFPDDPFSTSWDYENDSFQKALLNCIEEALGIIKDKDPRYFQSKISLLENLQTITPQILIARIYGKYPECFFQDAYFFLLANNRRLNLGNYYQQYSRYLISEIFSYLSKTEQETLLDEVLLFLPVYKHGNTHTLSLSGIEQFSILKSLPYQKLSFKAKRRLQELEYKFPNIVIGQIPEFPKAGFVQSPLSEKVIKKMTNKEWIRAMEKYSDRYGDHSRNDFLKGGALELSRLLKEEVKANPVRYSGIFNNITFDINDYYIEALIMGLAESENSFDLLISAVRKYSKQSSRKITRTIASAIELRSGENIPDDIVLYLDSIVHSIEKDEESWWSKGENNGDIFSSYLNSDRGASFSAIMRVLDNRNTNIAINKKWELIEFVSSDSSLSLRLGAIHELTYMVNTDRNRAINLFIELVEDNDILLSTSKSNNFIYYAMYKNFLKLYKYIEKMMISSIENIQEFGGSLACVAGLSNLAMESEEAFEISQKIADKAISGMLTWKRGAAKVYSQNFISKNYSLCESKLTLLLDVDDDQIQRTIDQVFYEIRNEDIRIYHNFIEIFAQKAKVPSYRFNQFLLENCLDDTNWTLNVVERVLNNDSLLSESSWHAGVDDLFRIIIKVYTSKKDRNLQKRAMDLFDEITKKAPIISKNVLDEWDSR